MPTPEKGVLILPANMLKYFENSAVGAQLRSATTDGHGSIKIEISPAESAEFSQKMGKGELSVFPKILSWILEFEIVAEMFACLVTIFVVMRFAEWLFTHIWDPPRDPKDPNDQIRVIYKDLVMPTYAM